MPANNLIMDIKIKIDNIAVDYETKKNKDENDIRMLSHIQKTRSALDELLVKIRKRIPKMDISELNKVKADLNYLSHEINSNKYTDAKKIILVEQKLESLNEEYEKIIFENRTLEEKILAVKEKKELEQKQEQELKDKINANITRIMEAKAAKKTAEINEQRDREIRISNAISRVKMEKAKENTNSINKADISEEKISIAVNNTAEKSRSMVHKSEDKKKSLTFITKIKNKMNSLRERANEKSKRKLPWIVAIPLGAVFAISFVNSVQVKETTDGLKDNRNSYVDNELPTENEKTTEFDSSLHWNEIGPNNSFSEGEKQRFWGPIIENYNKHQKSNEKNGIDEDVVDNNKVEDLKENNNVEENKETVEDKDKVVNVGDKIKVHDGLRYTETCYGEGNVGYIGDVSWRPATEYSIERVAFSYNNQILGLTDENTISINDDLEKYAKQYNIDIDQIQIKVLLSLIPGTYDTGWADLTINDIQKDSVKYNFTDKTTEDINVENDEIER